MGGDGEAALRSDSCVTDCGSERGSMLSISYRLMDKRCSRVPIAFCVDVDFGEKVFWTRGKTRGRTNRCTFVVVVIGKGDDVIEVWQLQVVQPFTYRIFFRKRFGEGSRGRGRTRQRVTPTWKFCGWSGRLSWWVVEGLGTRFQRTSWWRIQRLAKWILNNNDDTWNSVMIVMMVWLESWNVVLGDSIYLFKMICLFFLIRILTTNI